MKKERIQRRLAAIVVADVAGYSRLMELEEEATLASLNSHLNELIIPAINIHDGRIVKTMGDGFLAEFSSVVEAVRCSVAMQDGMHKRNSKVDKGHRIHFRIGVNLGDVILQENDVFGDGVNIAARLEGLSKPGGIVISRSVLEQVKSKIDLEFEDLGQRKVKNIGRPVRAFAIKRAAKQQPASLQNQILSTPDLPSVAVLPFDNLSSDPDQEYFSDGITEDIITELSKISGLFVISRHSVLNYKGKPVTLKQIGSELGVRYILEGSVRRAGNQLRISAQLVDIQSDLYMMWAAQYDRELIDIFQVQSEVARCVAGELMVTLKDRESGATVVPLTSNMAAYDLYMRARQTPFPPTRENILSAQNAYEQIVTLDPKFVGGHAGIALMHAMAVVFGVSADVVSDVEIAIGAAKTALSIDDKFAPAHSAMGMGFLAKGMHKQSVSSTLTATQLQPSDADAFSYLGIALLFAGRGNEASTAAKTALRLDPQYAGGPYLNLLGAALFLSEDYLASIEAFEANIAKGGPMGPTMLHIWAAASAAVGNLEKAKKVSSDLLRIFPDFRIEKYGMIKLYNDTDHIRRLKHNLKLAGLPE
jgi:adenylate cyclase